MQGRGREVSIQFLAQTVVGGRGSEASEDVVATSGDFGASEDQGRNQPCGVDPDIEYNPSFQRSIHSVLAARNYSIDSDMHGTALPLLVGDTQVLEADARRDRESCERKCTGRRAVSFACKISVICTYQIP